MPVISPTEYGIKPRPDHKPGYILVTPTEQQFFEVDGTDVRLDRIRVFGPNGFERSYLRDKIGQRFTDNLSGTEDDFAYLVTPEKKRERRF